VSPKVHHESPGRRLNCNCGHQATAHNPKADSCGGLPPSCASVARAVPSRGVRRQRSLRDAAAVGRPRRRLGILGSTTGLRFSLDHGPPLDPRTPGLRVWHPSERDETSLAAQTARGNDGPARGRSDRSRSQSVVPLTDLDGSECSSGRTESAPPDPDDHFSTVASRIFTASPALPNPRRTSSEPTRVTFGPMVHVCGLFVPVWWS
jgi:hypothetical protein